ncbi:MAG: hypothetical protein RR758_06540, partial [Burkholderiaceae bacterium]
GRAVVWISASALLPLCLLQLVLMRMHGSSWVAFADLVANPIYGFSLLPAPLGLWLAAWWSRRRLAPVMA